MASLNSIKRTGKRPYRRVGRGQSSGRGKQSGRGGKGQTARAGNKRRPEMRDIIKKLPKRRGYGKNRARTVDASLRDAVAISLTRLDALFPGGAKITPKILAARGVIGRRLPPVKIVGGVTSKKFNISGCAVSASARAVLEKNGSTVAPFISARVSKASNLASAEKSEKAVKTEKVAKSAQGRSVSGGKPAKAKKITS